MRVDVPDGSDFTFANLPLGVARHAAGEPGTYVAVGDHALDLAALAGRVDVGVAPEAFALPDLNAFLAHGPEAWREVRSVVSHVLRAGPDEDLLVPRASLHMLPPFAVADYVDMYSGIHHATSMGRMLRPESEPLPPNWRHVPVGYHGRAGTVVVSGTEIVRPRGHVVTADGVAFAPTAQLDVEIEVGFVVGVGSALGEPVPVDRFAEHVFGLVLVNDWSARDVQAFEYQPLGPFLGKSFATSVSPWVVPLDALAPHLVHGLTATQDPPPSAHLRSSRPWVPDMHLEILLQTAAMRERGEEPARVSTVALADALYWSMAQQLAHLTSNGASVRTGDLVASGTVSGPDPATQGGSLAELTGRGDRPLTLPDGEQRGFLADGDRVVMRGWCGSGDDRVGLGAVEGTVVPARGW